MDRRLRLPFHRLWPLLLCLGACYMLVNDENRLIMNMMNTDRLIPEKLTSIVDHRRTDCNHYFIKLTKHNVIVRQHKQ